MPPENSQTPIATVLCRTSYSIFNPPSRFPLSAAQNLCHHSTPYGIHSLNCVRNAAEYEDIEYFMKPELIIALDVPSSDSIPKIVDSLPTSVRFYKVGLELFAADGPASLDYLKRTNRKIFLDLKLHDIPRTVARAVASAAKHGANLLTVHAGGGREMLKAAAEAAKESGNSDLRIVAVTTLTSLNQADLIEMGITRPLVEHTLSLGEMAISAGIDGLVCSPNEAAAFRQRIGNEPILVTPGIRPAGADVGDQKRIATPEMAVKAGASYLVVGRPILDAKDPSAAAAEIMRQMIL